MTPELLQERENRLRRAFLENDFGEASDRLNNAAEFGIIENKEQFLKASAVAGWAGSQMNRPVNPTSPDWQGIKDGIVRGYFKKKDAKNVTDDELFAQIAADYKAQDAAFEAAKDAAARGESWLGKFREKEAALPEMAGGRQTSYLGMTRQVHDAFRAKIAPYQTTIASVAQKARSIQGPEGADYGSMADELIKIPKEDRPFVLEAISRQIAAKDETGAAQNLMINFDRGIERYLDTAVSGLERFGESQVGRFIRAAQGFDIQAQTPEEVEKRAQYLDLRDDMRGIATGKLSKLNDVRLLGMNLSGAARNAAMTLGAFVPYVGPAAMVSSFARETANEIRQQNPTMSRADAEQIAMVSAPFQAATEVISDRILFGKLPNLKRVFTMPVFSAGGIAGQLATRVGVATGTELAEELAQGTIPRVIQALKDDVPDVDWDGYFEDFKDQAPEMIAEILPMALLGAGVGQLSDYRAGHELIKNRDLLVAAKLTPEEADAIAGAAESGDFTKAESLLRTAWPKAAAQGQAPSEVRDNAVQSFLARSQAVRQEQERAAAEAEAIGVAVIRDAEGWKVRMSDGSVIPADSAEAATRMQKDMAMAASEYEAETMVAAVDEMLAQQPTRRFEITAEVAQAGDNGLVFTNPITGQVREIKDEASLQNLRDEQMALAKKEGEEPAAAMILGMNRFEFGNGIISVFQRGLNKDGTADVPRIITAMHEQIEASWRKGVVTGQFSEAESRAAVANLMSQLDVARLGKSATDQEKAWFERAATVARGEGDENLLREVISELAVRTWIGRDKVGEKTGLRPGTVLRALDAAVLKAKQPAEMSMMKRIRAWIKAVGAYLRGVVATAKLISQAEQSGTVTDYTEFMDKLLGLTESRREDMAQAEQIKQQMEDDGVAFSLSPTTSQDAEYLAAVKAGDNGNDSLVDQLRKSSLPSDTRAARETLAKAVSDVWAMNNPKSAAKLRAMIDARAVAAGVYSEDGRQPMLFYRGGTEAGKMSYPGTSFWTPVKAVAEDYAKDAGDFLGMDIGRKNAAARNTQVIDALLKDGVPDDLVRAVGYTAIEKLVGAPVGAADGWFEAYLDSARGSAQNQTASRQRLIAALDAFLKSDTADHARDLLRLTKEAAPAMSLQDDSTTPGAYRTLHNLLTGVPEGAPAELAALKRAYVDDLEKMGAGEVVSLTRSATDPGAYFAPFRSVRRVGLILGDKIKRTSETGVITRDSVAQAQKEGFTAWWNDKAVGGATLGRDNRAAEVVPLGAVEGSVKSLELVNLDNSGNVIPLSQRFKTESADIRFSLSPTSSADQLAQIIESIMQSRPDLAFKIRQRSLADIGRLIQNWSAERVTWKGDKVRPVVEKRTKASLDKEQAMREAVRYAELLDSGMATLTPETLMAWSEGVGKLEQHPLIRQMLGAHGRLMSKSTADSLGKLKTDGKGKAGDYDGAGWLPPQWYSGSAGGIMPDVMAQNLYDDGLLNEPTPDALWQALDSVITTHRTAKAEYAKAELAVKSVENQAKEKAKAEAAAWREETEDMMADDWSPRESLQRDARLFNTAMAAFPAEIRAKIVPGGMVKLAGLATERARYKVIEKAMQKAVVELEKFMRKEQLAEVVKLLDKSGPVGAPGEVKKSRFIVTVQDELDAISEVVGMDVDEVDREMAQVEAALIAAQTPEDADTALTRLNLLETFGGILDIKNTTSVELDTARQYLEGLMAQGRAARRILDEARREAVKAMVEAASKDAFKGVTGPETTQEARKKSAKASGKAMLKKFFNELSGFDGVLRDAFGPNSETATKFSERFTLNSNNFEDTQNERRKRLRDFARDLYRTRLGAVINQKLIKLEQIESTSGVTYLKGREVKTHKFTVDDALKIVADPKAFGFTDAQAQEISDEIQAVQMAGGRRTSFTYEQEISKGDRVELPLSQMNAAYLSMALRQPGILEQQQRYGYDQQTVDELEAFLTDDAKRWREWMQGEYDAEYARANAVYMRMFNTRMPRIQFYAPLLKNHQGAQATLDPLNTGLVAQSANPGSLKTRKSRTSSIRIESALSVFWSHFNQMDYWVTHAEYLRDVQAVMLNPKVRESVVSAHGEEGMQTISAWVSLQMARGVSKGALAVAGSRMFRNVKSAVSMKALALNLGTSLKTIPSVLYSLGEIHLSKWPAALASGVKHWSRLWDTNIIQRRLDIGGMPELRDLGSSALPMSWVNQAIRYGSYPTMYADGVLTTFSAAMAYGVNYDAAIEQGATEDAAHEYAKERTALIVSKTAQPENWTQKSLFENDASGAGSLFFMFTSDPRQKLALAGEALNNWRKGTATTEEAMRKFLAYWVIPGVMFQLANAIGRSLFKGDDDEWDVVDFATAGIVGQLQGLALLGSAAEMIVAAAVAAGAEKITGEEVKRKPFWNSPKNPLDQAAQEIVKASESLDLEDGQDGLEKAWQLTKAGGMLISPFTPAGALPSTAERVMKDTTNLFYREE